MDASLWHSEQKTQYNKEYYLIIRDDDQTIPFILKYDAATFSVAAEPYCPPDINYTIHDGCDHENDGCVLDNPESMESQEVAEAGAFNLAKNNLDKLEEQLKQQRIADSLISAKRAQSDG
jgi:hypothetical protein